MRNSPIKQSGTTSQLSRTLKLEAKIFGALPAQSAVATPAKRATKPYKAGSFLFNQPAPVKSGGGSSHWGKKNQSPSISKILSSASKPENVYQDEEQPSKRKVHQTSSSMQAILTIP
jgi:hypothetical protein